MMQLGQSNEARVQVSQLGTQGYILSTTRPGTYLGLGRAR